VRNANKILVGRPKGKNHVEDLNSVYSTKVGDMEDSNTLGLYIFDKMSEGRQG
jgi:hypothetical protein